MNRKMLLWLIPALLVVLALFWGISRWQRQPPPVVTIDLGTPAALSVPVLVPTFTPTPMPDDTAANTAANTEPRSVQETAPTPTDGPTPLPHARLDEAARLHRYGYYTEEQWLLLELLADPDVDAALASTARYRLVESYLAEDNDAQALAMIEEFERGVDALPADDEKRTQIVFLRAEALVGLGRADEAVNAYLRFLQSHPELTEVIYELVAEIRRSAGNYAGAAADYQRAADPVENRVTQARLLESAATMLESAGQWAAAAAVYDEILAFAENPTYRASLATKAGNAYAEADDPTTALARWQSVIDDYPESRSSYPALAALVDRDVAVDLFVRGIIDLNAEAYYPAIDAFTAFLAQSPDEARAGRAVLGLGQSHLALGNWAEAQTFLEQVIANYPDCTCFGQAWLDKARIEILRGDDTNGRRILRTFAREHPQDSLAAEALWRSALSAISADNQIEAAADFLTLVDGFPNSERAPRALYVLGIGSMVNKLYAQARSSFSRLQSGYPESRWQAAAYWRGRAHAALGEEDEARAQWQTLVAREPDTYYGVLAGLALAGTVRQNLFDAVEALPNPASTLAGDDGSRAFADRWLAEQMQLPAAALGRLTPALLADADLAAGELLLTLDRRGEGLALLDRVYNRYQDNPAALYALTLHFEEIGTYRHSISAATRLLTLSGATLVEDAPIFLQKIAYPIHFSELVDAEAAVNDLDPLLFYSLIRQESLFEEGARSYAAAQGLAQIIPSTGQEIAGRINYPNYSNDLIYRPHINVKFGTFYLDWVRDYVNDSIVAALAGYNAGPGNAATWQRLTAGDETLFVELMTLDEPRLYVERILAHYYHYNRLYR